MFCGNCGKNFDDESAFCPYCGSRVDLFNVELQEPDADQSVADALYNETKLAPDDKERKNSTVIVIVAIVVIMVLIAAIAIYLFKTGKLNIFNNASSNKSEIEEYSVDDAEDIEEYSSDDTEEIGATNLYDGDLYYAYGNTYRVMTNLRVREGPGKKYRILDREELQPDDYKKSVDSTSTRDALIEKGKTVTCLGMEGDWMRIQSGWICVYDGEVLVQ